MDGVRVATREMGTITIASVEGEIDSHNAGHFRTKMVSLLSESTSAMVIDLSGVQTLDSSGLGALLDARSRADEVGARITLVYDDPIVGRAIEIAGLDTIFTTATSVDEAVRGG